MKQRGSILIVDDEEDIILSLKMLLKPLFSSVFGETNPFHLPRLIKQYEPDVILLDLNFRPGQQDGKEGLEWLEKIKELRPASEVIMITAHGDVPLVVQALKKGAADFIEKPWRNEKVIATIQSAIKIARGSEQNAQLKGENEALNEQLFATSDTFIGSSPAMQSVMKAAQKLAPTDASVLVMGENGTGKEVMARYIHQASERKEGPFIMVDLGAIPDNLLESELFGYKRGAFTDAKTDKIGRFAAAHGGTIFLDEIGNLSKNSQAKLLQAIQSKTITPLGGTKSQQVDIRFISATNVSLPDMVKASDFRQDLLFRINTIELLLPPLRERGEDILPLAQFFLDRLKVKYRKPDLSISPSSERKLQSYSWPGNVRELEHAIERGVILSEGNHLSLDHIIETSLDTALDDSMTLEEMERTRIVQCMRKHKGNISKAADELGITRPALYRRIEKFGI